MTSIDILLPFWGDVGYMEQAVRSIQAQTDPDWQLVVVDDCYPDRGSSRVVRRRSATPGSSTHATRPTSGPTPTTGRPSRTRGRTTSS